MINKNLENVLNDSLREAQVRNHAFLTLEHLLYAILNNEEGRDIIENSGGEIELLTRDLLEFLESCEIDLANSGEPIQTIAFQRIIEEALYKVHSAQKKEVEIGDILVAIFQEEDSQAKYYLEKQGVSRIDILQYISHGISKESEKNHTEEEYDDYEEEEPSFSRDSAGKAERKALEAYTVNMTKEAKKGVYDALIGREDELKRTIEILSRRTKNNPLHVGEPGVGKTSLAQGLAYRIVTGNIPDRLKNFSVFSVDMGSILAGTRFRGDFEQRVKNLFKGFQKIGNVIVFIDEIHTIVGAGQVQGSAMDAANLLKPLLTNGDLRCIGSTTYEEYRKFFEKDRALSRRFQKIDIREPSIEDTVKILKGLQNKYEDFHKVTYSSSAIRAAAELSSKYIKDRFLPDKAIDVIDEAGANISLYRSHKHRITATDIEKYVSRVAGIPVTSVGESQKNSLKNLAEVLKNKIYGQDIAVEKLVNAIRRNHAGFASDTKPVGSFLLVGPTGVGKTELARQIAESLGIELLRFDMSEYMEKHSVSRLLGSPPGYVGFDQGALLTDGVRKHPRCVLLLDEIEKAHPDIFNTLLQIMDNATATDATGRMAHFANVLLLMTSNVGAREMSANLIGFTSDGKMQKGDGKNELKKTFSPEFINRLDGILTFARLEESVIKKIVLKFLNELNLQLKRRNIQLSASEKAISRLATLGVDPEYGARPMARVIQEKIKDPLTELILDGKINRGQKILLQIENDQFTFFPANTKKPSRKKRKQVTV